MSSFSNGVKCTTMCDATDCTNLELAGAGEIMIMADTEQAGRDGFFQEKRRWRPRCTNSVQQLLYNNVMR